jgi:sulfatase modifying factor 1
MVARSLSLLTLLCACSTQETTTSQPAASVPVAARTASAALSVGPPLSTTPPKQAPPERARWAGSQTELLSLVPKHAPKHDAWLARHVDIGGPGKMNQGNHAIAHHAIGRRACREGLNALTLQTPQQRERCAGHPNMVPIYRDGDDKGAKTCVDIFDFPTPGCVLPLVWGGASSARALCRKLGKRLCTQDEWALACAGDPAGGADRRYAYGDELDLTTCNTNKSKEKYNRGHGCDPATIHTAWETCSTNTEPAGAFPRCRSRFGVFDLHGNVAEAMTRFDAAEGKNMSQLKGSAFFYTDVHRADVPQKGGEEPRSDTYSDHCRHDPRWHVQDMAKAWHVNYHLGFRCCLTVAE